LVALSVISPVDLGEAFPKAWIAAIALVAAVRFPAGFTFLAREPIHRFVVFPGIFPILPRGTITAVPIPIIIVPAIRRTAVRFRPSGLMSMVPIAIMGNCRRGHPQQ